MSLSFSPQPSLSTNPYDIMAKILRFLPGRDLRAMACVSKIFNSHSKRYLSQYHQRIDQWFESLEKDKRYPDFPIKTIGHLLRTKRHCRLLNMHELLNKVGLYGRNFPIRFLPKEKIAVYESWHDDLGLHRTLVSMAKVRKFAENGKRVVLPGAYLAYGNFGGLNLQKADLSRACLIYAAFYETNFKEANLEGASFDYARFCKVNLVRANLNNTILGSTYFIEVDLTGTTFVGSYATFFPRFKKTRLSGSQLTGCRFGKLLSNIKLDKLSINRATRAYLTFTRRYERLEWLHSGMIGNIVFSLLETKCHPIKLLSAWRGIAVSLYKTKVRNECNLD